MIDQRHTQQSARALWSGYVHRLFQTLKLEDRPAAEDISESVACFCQQQPRMPGHTLSLLMARSFCAIGDAEAAERILRSDRRHAPYTDSWLEVLSTEYPFPELVPLFSSRALRPVRMTSAGGSLWVLDFENIQLTETDRHELILLQTIRVLMEKVSNVWKKTDGRGTLGVKALNRPAQLIRTRRSEPQLLDHMRAVFDLLAQKNHWACTPDVLLLNL